MPMPIRLLVIALVVLAPITATAQNVSPTEVKVIAIGNFLGQLDGFCEQPGGTYDKDFLKNPQVQGCADRNGEVGYTDEKKKWPAALGGMLGARTRVKAERDSNTRAEATKIGAGDVVLPLLVVPGNNQVANFAFLEEDAVDPKAQYEIAPQPVDPASDRLVQTKGRLKRFWQEMAAMEPQAIGLGAEDFIRSLRDPRDRATTTPKPRNEETLRNRGSILHRWLRQVTRQGTSAKLPIIGSNVIIKTRSKEKPLNVIKAGDFSLSDITKNESAGWMTKISVSHPARPKIMLTLWDMGPLGQTAKERHIDTKETDGTAVSTEFENKEGTLRPGHRYELRVREGDTLRTLSFQTHMALTPRQNSSATDKDNAYTALDGFPVVAKRLADGSPMMLMSLIDPDVKDLLGESAWKWERESCTSTNKAECDFQQYTCPADECEIDFIQAKDAVSAAILRADPKGDRPKPFILMISALSDAQNLELLEELPEIRLAVLHPDSSGLGRASRIFSSDMKDLEKRLAKRGKSDQAYSGDLGFSAVLSPEKPTGTTLVARPEWVGESLATMSARLSREPEADEWKIENAKISVGLVPGAALAWRKCKPGVTVAGDATACTEFFMRWPGSAEADETSYGSFRSYLVCDPDDPTVPVDWNERRGDTLLSDQCAMFSKLWTKEFSTFAGDTLRRATGSELALVPGLLLDPDAQAWLNPLIDPTRTRLLTRFILERSVLRSFRIVRASVSGDALLATLDKALKATEHPDSCVVGVMTSCAKKINVEATDTTQVNGRAIDSRAYYSIAMPEGLAKQMGLPHSKDTRHTTDAVSALNQRFQPPDKEEDKDQDNDKNKDGWYVSGKEDELAQRIERRAKNKLQSDFLISTLQFGFSRLKPDAALNSGNTLRALDVDFRRADDEQTLTTKLDVDIAAIDHALFAVRGIVEIDINRRTEFNDKLGDQRTYPSNRLLYGGRFDWKHLLYNREMRFYGGYFVDRELQGPRRYINATITQEKTEAFTVARTEQQPTLFKQDPLEFEYLAAGVDYLNVKKLFTIDLSRASLEYASGRLNNIPVGAEYPDDSSSRTMGSAQTVLNALYQRGPSTFNPTRVLRSFPDQPRDQQRIQAEANFERTFSIEDRKGKLSVEARARFFPKTSDTMDDSLKHYWRTIVSLSVPATTRIEIVPLVEFHRATIVKASPEVDKATFNYLKWEINLKVPFVVRRGWGWLLR